MSGLVLQSKDNIMQLAQTKADLVELENELFIRKEHVKTDVRRAVQDLMRYEMHTIFTTRALPLSRGSSQWSDYTAMVSIIVSKYNEI